MLSSPHLMLAHARRDDGLLLPLSVLPQTQLLVQLLDNLLRLHMVVRLRSLKRKRIVSFPLHDLIHPLTPNPGRSAGSRRPNEGYKSV